VLDKPTRKRLNEEVSAHETKLYGPSISSQKQEVAIILDTLTTLQSSPQLSHTQKDTLQTYINQQTNTHKITTHRQTQTSHTNTPEGKTIPPTIVKQIFEYVFDFYEEVEENFHKRTVKI
jgi:phosphoenolpyruvate carboxylase